MGSVAIVNVLIITLYGQVRAFCVQDVYAYIALEVYKSTFKYNVFLEKCSDQLFVNRGIDR